MNFQKHDSSGCHKQVVEKMITLPATTRDVDEMLFCIHSSEKEANHKFLLKILSNLQFLARQGCAIRRGGEHETDSNFYHQYKLQCEDDSFLEEWLKKERKKYTSHEVQN